MCRWTWTSSGASSRGSCARRRHPASGRVPPWTRCCARTSPMATAGCRGPSRSSWATAASCARSSRTCSTRPRRDSAMGRMRTMLGGYFDGDASRLAQLLDPTRLGSPLHQFRTEVSDGFSRLNERLTAIEAAGAARAGERARSRRPRAPTSRTSWATLLGEVCRGTGDAVDRTGDETGDVIRSRKGDFLLTIDPALTRGADLRVVVECKDRAISGKQMRDELAEAKRNRARPGRAGGVHARRTRPAGIAPFDVRLGRRLLRHRPGGAGPGRAGCRHPAGPAARHRDARGARAGGGHRGHRRRHHRRPGPAGRHPGAQDAADVDRHRGPGGQRAASTACARASWRVSRTWSGRSGSRRARRRLRQPADGPSGRAAHGRRSSPGRTGTMRHRPAHEDRPDHRQGTP